MLVETQSKAEVVLMSDQDYFIRDLPPNLKSHEDNSTFLKCYDDQVKQSLHDNDVFLQRVTIPSPRSPELGTFKVSSHCNDTNLAVC